MKAHIPDQIGDFIPLSSLRTMVDRLKDRPDDMAITFEFLCASLFPTIYENVQTALNKSYTDGYIEGRKSINES
jgi:hypothetical protein